MACPGRACGIIPWLPRGMKGQHLSRSYKEQPAQAIMQAQTVILPTVYDQDGTAISRHSCKDKSYVQPLGMASPALHSWWKVVQV